MSPAQVKIFISWSGSPSKEIALILKTWLEEVYDGLTAWVSDRDIDAGARSMNAIEESLAGARAGVIVVTRSNMNKPWINFEAGALSKALDEAAQENRVIPLLVGFQRPAELQGPMSILQAVMLNREGIGSMLRSLNTILGLDPARADTKIQRFWDDLERKVGPLQQQALKDLAADPQDARTPSMDPEAMIPEMLEILRSMRDEGGPSSSSRRANELKENQRSKPLSDSSSLQKIYAAVDDWVKASKLENELSPYIFAPETRSGNRLMMVVLTRVPLTAARAEELTQDLRAFIGRSDIMVRTTLEEI